MLANGVIEKRLVYRESLDFGEIGSFLAILTETQVLMAALAAAIKSS